MMAAAAHNEPADRERDVASERGFSALELVLAMAFLLLPVTLLVTSVPIWIETQASARVAAQEAARVVAVAGDGAAARDRARQLVDQVAANRRLDVRDIRFASSVNAAGQSMAEAAVTVRLPVVHLPLLGGLVATDWTVTHHEPIDLYRESA